MENFIVSARKFRPQTFRSVVGQAHVTETLRNAIARGQLAHAYLFTGPRGVGKTTCARIFARAINCLTPTADHEACGVCESCVAFAADRSFNIHEMDAASNNGVDDIRALNEKVRIAPQIGRYSVYIIDEVHMLSTGAFNAFLKTLEEPPAHAIFILATTEKHKILPTILSRCQTYDFNRIRVDDTVKYLRYICEQQGVTADDESLHIIAQASDGGMRDALSTFDRVVSFCGSELTYVAVAESVGTLDFATYFSAVDMAGKGDFASLLMLFDSILGKGFEAQHFLSGLAAHVRSLLVAKNPQTLPLLETTAALTTRYAEQASRVEFDFLFRAVNLLSAADATFRTSTSRRLHVELALLKLCGLVGGDVAAVSARAVLPQVVAVPSLPQTVPTSAPISAAIAAPAPIAAPEEVVPVTVPMPAPAPAAQGSVLGFSINGSAGRPDTGKPVAATSAVIEHTREQIDEILTARFSELIAVWESRQRPRIATALATHSISGGTVTLIASNEVLHGELIQSKLDIQRDIQSMFGVNANVDVELREEQTAQVSRPVTLEQRLQHLVDKNPAVLKLKDTFDLTT